MGQRYQKERDRLSAAGNDPSSVSEAVHENDPDELVDLTVLDSNMVYAMVYDMVNCPESYEGQTVRAKGTFAHTEYNGKDYFAVLIADATACCSQGMEFVLKGSYVYPMIIPRQTPRSLLREYSIPIWRTAIAIAS